MNQWRYQWPLAPLPRDREDWLEALARRRQWHPLVPCDDRPRDMGHDALAYTTSRQPIKPVAFSEELH